MTKSNYMNLRKLTLTRIGALLVVCVLLVGAFAMGSSVLAQEQTTREGEPNDVKDDANTVQLGTSFEGSVAVDDGGDWIAVEGIQPGQNVTIEITTEIGDIRTTQERFEPTTDGDLSRIENDTTEQRSGTVGEPPLLINIQEDFENESVASTSYTVHVTAGDAGEETTTEEPTTEESSTEEEPETATPTDTTTPTEEEQTDSAPPEQNIDIGQNDEDDDGDGHVDEDGEDGNDVPSNDDDDGDGAVDEDDEPDDGDDGSDDFNGNAEDDDDGDGHYDEDDEDDGGNSDDEDNDGDGAIDEDDEPDNDD